jgi:hypothetical protein
MSAVLISRRAVLLAPLALMLPSCEAGGNFSLFGYTTRPNFRCDIASVRVPIFKSMIYRDSVRQGLEMDLTKAVVRQIQLWTPYKVKDDADTELTGTIVSLTKNILNRNQQNLPREVETDLAVEVVWKDLRSGEVLSRPARGPGALPPPPAPDAPPPPPGTPPPPGPGVMVFSLGQLIPEVGQSSTTAYQENVERLARQIVHMMEQPW